MASSTKDDVRLPPLSDPRITVTPRINENLRQALQKQSEAIARLLKAQPEGVFLDAIDDLIQAIKELSELMPQIEDATGFALNAGWEYGAERGISEQNTKSARMRHERSNEAKKKLHELWQTGRWPTKVACVKKNYESLMREAGLWELGQKDTKPSQETLIRWLQKIKDT